MVEKHVQAFVIFCLSACACSDVTS